MMRKILIALAALIPVIFFSCNQRNGKPKVLLFTKVADFRHTSIPAGVSAIEKLAGSNDFDIDTTSNTDLFTDDSLKNYAAVIFLSTTGDVLDSRQETAFERFTQSGGGYVGIHAA